MPPRKPDNTKRIEDPRLRELLGLPPLHRPELTLPRPKPGHPPLVRGRLLPPSLVALLSAAPVRGPRVARAGADGTSVAGALDAPFDSGDEERTPTQKRVDSALLIADILSLGVGGAARRGGAAIAKAAGTAASRGTAAQRAVRFAELTAERAMRAPAFARRGGEVVEREGHFGVNSFLRMNERAAARNPGLRDAITNAGDGFTLDAAGKPFAGTGEVVAYKDLTKMIESPTPATIDEFLARPEIREALAKPGHYAGGWRDPATGKLEINVVRRFDSPVEATTFARQQKRKAVGVFKDSEYVRDRPFLTGPSVQGADGNWYTGYNHQDAKDKAIDAMRATPEGRAAMERNGSNPLIRGKDRYFDTSDERHLPANDPETANIGRDQGVPLDKAYQNIHSSDFNKAGVSGARVLAPIAGAGVGAAAGGAADPENPVLGAVAGGLAGGLGANAAMRAMERSAAKLGHSTTVGGRYRHRGPNYQPVAPSAETMRRRLQDAHDVGSRTFQLKRWIGTGPESITPEELRRLRIIGGGKRGAAGSPIRQSDFARQRADPIVAAAIKGPDGQIYRGANHGEAANALEDAGFPAEAEAYRNSHSSNPPLPEGFVTTSGQFVSRRDLQTELGRRPVGELMNLPKNERGAAGSPILLPREEAMLEASPRLQANFGAALSRPNQPSPEVWIHGARAGENMAMSSNIRDAARQMGWEPRQVQAANWSYGKGLAESGGLDIGLHPSQLDLSGIEGSSPFLTQQRLASIPDFAGLMGTPAAAPFANAATPPVIDPAALKVLMQNMSRNWRR